MSEDTRDLLIRIDERTEQTQKDVDLLKHVILEGNGTPALTVQVATLDHRMRSIEDNKKDTAVPRHVTIGLIVSIVIAIGGALVGFAQS